MPQLGWYGSTNPENLPRHPPKGTNERPPHMSLSLLLTYVVTDPPLYTRAETGYLGCTE